LAIDHKARNFAGLFCFLAGKIKNLWGTFATGRPYLVSLEMMTIMMVFLGMTIQLGLEEMRAESLGRDLFSSMSLPKKTSICASQRTFHTVVLL
jgi:hypothetical protein